MSKVDRKRVLQDTWDESEWELVGLTDVLGGFKRKPKDGRRAYPHAHIYPEFDGYHVQVEVYNKNLWPGFVKTWGGFVPGSLERAKQEADRAVVRSLKQR